MEQIESSEDIKIPIKILEKALEENNSDILKLLINHPNTPVEILTTIILTNSDQEIIKKALQHPNLDFLARYRLELTLEEKQLKKEALPVLLTLPDSHYAMSEVVKIGNVNACIEIARNPKTPIEILQQLSQSENEVIRKVVSDNTRLPLENLLNLAQDPSSNVRVWMAQRRHTLPIEVLEILALDEDSEVKLRLAENPTTPSQILTTLVTNTDSKVIVAALANSNASEEILAEYLPNINDPEELEQILRSDNSGTVSQKCQPIPSEILNELAQHPSDVIRFLVGRHLYTPPETLSRLALDSYSLVRETVAENPNTPTETLIEMARLDSPDDNVSFIIASRQDSPPEANVNTPDDLESRLSPNVLNISNTLKGLSRIYDPKTDDLPSLLREYVVSSSPFVRFVTLMHPLTPSEILTEAAKSLFWLDRYAVTKNSATVENVKQELTLDSNAAVRCTAKSNLY